MLIFTDLAVIALNKISQANHNKDFRILIKGGACAGFTYNFVLDDEKRFDTIYTFDNIKVLVDSKSMNYISGSTIDYVDSLMEKKFKIINPNEAFTCSCGKSFALK
jgi:iron-sulfur cluster assembly accessory protein